MNECGLIDVRYTNSFIKKTISRRSTIVSFILFPSPLMIFISNQMETHAIPTAAISLKALNVDRCLLDQSMTEKKELS